MESGLFYYKIVFMTELLIIEGIFCAHLERRKLFWLRLFISLAICYSASVFYPLLSYSGWYSSLMFILFFILAFLSILICFKTKVVNALFLAITAYTVQHLSYELFSLLSDIVSSSDFFNLYGSSAIDFTNISSEAVLAISIYVEIYFVVYVFSYFLLARRIYRQYEIQLKNTNLFFLTCLLLLFDIVINAFVIYIDSNANKMYGIIISVYNILCCLLVFYIEFSLVNAKNMEQEIDTTKYLLEQAKKQYSTSKENINAINMKCHNLRYQVGKYARKGGIDDSSAKEIENIISIYDSKVQTGIEALDIILTEKSMLCHNRNVNLTCMVDGKKLSFIHDSDLYVLFGNAIDNAIETVEKFTEKDKRYIGLTIYSANSFVSININNFYQGEIEFDENGLPVTSKKDKTCHGFGVKSMKMIVEKYGGDFMVEAKDGIFNLNILFPVKS